MGFKQYILSRLRKINCNLLDNYPIQFRRLRPNQKF